MRTVRMPRVRVDRDRGAVTVIFALLFACLLAAAGLGIDTSKVSYHRSRVQHSADAAALAVAFDCVTDKACDVPSATSTGNYFADENSEGGAASIPSGLTGKVAGTVTVRIDKTVSTPFFSLLGVNSKDTGALATAIWTAHPVSGPVIPFGVAMCEYITSGVNAATVIRADVNRIMDSTIVPGQNTLATDAYDNMTGLTDTCTVPDDVKAIVPGIQSPLTMLQGGLWMSENGANINNGKLVDTDILEALTSVIDLPVNTPGKFAQYLAPGETMLFAIYAPTSNQDHAGLVLNGADAAFKGRVDMKIVGYAPFEVSGWCLGAGATACGGASPGVTGIAGQFIDAISEDPDFEFDDDGTDFGSYDIELTE